MTTKLRTLMNAEREHLLSAIASTKQKLSQAPAPRLEDEYEYARKLLEVLVIRSTALRIWDDLGCVETAEEVQRDIEMLTRSLVNSQYPEENRYRFEYTAIVGRATRHVISTLNGIIAKLTE